MAAKAEEGQLKGEGRLTKKALRQKLRRGKGPVIQLFGKGEGKRDIRHGLR
jgi:hypothetical protein